MSEDEDSKRFHMRRASVNNLTSRGVKDHGFCIQEVSEGKVKAERCLHTLILDSDT